MVGKRGQQGGVTLKAMNCIAGINETNFVKKLLVALLVVAAFTESSREQVYAPVFKSVEIQPTIAPLGEMVEGDFFGPKCIAALSKPEKAIYFFVPDSLESLVLKNIVILPDTPIAISKGRVVVVDSNGHKEGFAELAVLMKPNYVVLVSFDSAGQPEISAKATVDPYCTNVRASDMETSGKLDLVGFGKFSLGVSIEKNLGNGNFKSVQPMPGALGNVPFSDIAFTDFNGDLVPDMAALDWVNRKLLIFYGRGDGTFTQPVSFQLKAEPSALSVADLNGNGYPDIVVGYSRLPQIDIFEGDGFGRFFLRQSIKTPAPVSKFAIADFTGDGTMDIAALSRSTGEIMLYTYDPISRRFKYSGVIGAGVSYDNILPFYFRNRIRADLVASSAAQESIKVFKSALPFENYKGKLTPVGANANFVAVFGKDSSNYLITATSSGRMSAKYSTGLYPFDALSSVDWESGGTPRRVMVLSDSLPYILTSYTDADMLSLYEVGRKGGSVAEMRVETAFPPFAMAGEAEADSASIAAAYRFTPDGSVAISYFTAIKGKDEFLEHDYSINDTGRYLASALTVTPALSFLRIWKLSADTIRLAFTSLKSNETSIVNLPAQGARLLEKAGKGFPLLAVQGSDTLSLYSLVSGSVSGFSITKLASTPFDSTDFSSLELTPRSDSTYYLTFVNRTSKAVFLYLVANGRMQFTKAWRVNEYPAGVAISPDMKTIYFLNRAQAYVSVHSF